jgi:hypothetical protein
MKDGPTQLNTSTVGWVGLKKKNCMMGKYGQKIPYYTSVVGKEYIKYKEGKELVMPQGFISQLVRGS